MMGKKARSFAPLIHVGVPTFFPAESPLSLASGLLKRLSTLTGSPLWPGFARNLPSSALTQWVCQIRSAPSMRVLVP